MSSNLVGTIYGLVGSFVMRPIAERWEKRYIRTKIRELYEAYRQPFTEREKNSRKKLCDILAFAKAKVPYYKDLMSKRHFDPEKVLRDPAYIQDLPFLTKEIIREQKERMFSTALTSVRYHERKTGGSTGLSCMFYYDDVSLDYSSAVVAYARERVGKKKFYSELHFASRFPDVFPLKDRIRENLKCISLNRSNIFFDRLDQKGLKEIWEILKKRRPYLVHSHPSTLYALSRYVEQNHKAEKCFRVFESSGELLERYMRDSIEKIFQCRVVDRYGLAEFGVIAYQFNQGSTDLQVLDTEGWPESVKFHEYGTIFNELVFTGYRNFLMPLIRYRTGDLSKVVKREDGFYLTEIMGRIHDLIPIKGIDYPTHYIQDVLDRIGGIQEFQIDLRKTPTVLRIVPEPIADVEKICERIKGWWKDSFDIEIVGHGDLVRVGLRNKFRHVVKE